MRLLGFVWPVLFFVPLTEFAGRYCWLTGIDSVYHTLVLTHEYMPQILIAYGLVSAVVVLASDVRARSKLRHLATLAAPTPPAIDGLIRDEAHALVMNVPRCAYLNVGQSFCFTASGAHQIMLSRGFVSSLSLDELRLALRHELIHLKRSHPAKALAWRVVTRALLLPGFSALERWRHARREEVADRETAGDAADRYHRLLARTSAPGRAGPTVVLSWRLGALQGQRPLFPLIWPAVVAGCLLLALIFSHFVFMTRLHFLLTHHC